MKGNMFAMRLAFSHWGPPDRQLDNVLLTHTNKLMTKIFLDTKIYLSAKEPNSDLLAEIMDGFTELSAANEVLRREGLPPPELSRTNEYLRAILVQFQELKNIRIYRTPIALRAYTKFFLTIFPFIFGPSFSYMAEESGHLWHGIVIAVVYAIVLSGLDNIQEELENPFHGDGVDDIRFDDPVSLSSSIVLEDPLAVEASALVTGRVELRTCGQHEEAVS